MKDYLLKSLGYAMIVFLLFVGVIFAMMLEEKGIADGKEKKVRNKVGVIKVTDNNQSQEVVVYEADINGKKYLYTNQKSGINLVPVCTCQDSVKK